MQLYTFLATIFDAMALLPDFVHFFKAGPPFHNHSPPLLQSWHGFIGSCLRSVRLSCVGPAQGGNGTQERAATVAFVFLTVVLDLAFAASLLGFVVMHSNLVSQNMTTIEMYEKKKSIPWRYDYGKHKNFSEVFGNDKLYWLLPMHTESHLRVRPDPNSSRPVSSQEGAVFGVETRVCPCRIWTSQPGSLTM